MKNGQLIKMSFCGKVNRMLSISYKEPGGNTQRRKKGAETRKRKKDRKTDGARKQRGNRRIRAIKTVTNHVLLVLEQTSSLCSAFLHAIHKRPTTFIMFKT